MFQFGHKILLETHGPFYWTISSNEFMTYGCGAQNLIRAMKKYDYGTIGAVLQGVFGEHYFNKRKGENTYGKR